MTKDLTNSQLDRQNILNNEIAVNEVWDTLEIRAVHWNDGYFLTKDMVSSYFQVDIRTIERYINSNSDELLANGMQTLRGKHLAEFIDAYNAEFATDINVGHKIRNLTVFDFRSFLNIGMLLSESERAKNLRQLMLDIVIDLINRKTGGGTKYINQRDKDFLFSSLQEDNYRRQFTDALKECVVTDRYKYAHFTDLIYVSIFKEKAKEYKKILDLKATDKVRDTFYSEILDIVAAYESGLAEALRQECEKTGRPLTIDEAEALFRSFEEMALWKPLIQRGRVKMASRDLALRDAFHYQLSEYIQPLQQLVEERLAEMLGRNPSRIDYYERYQAIIQNYNAEQDRAAIEKAFSDLLDLANDLDSETERYIREGFENEEQLALFDLLKKDTLSKEDIKILKASAKDLLKVINKSISDMNNWREKESTRAAMESIIRDTLWGSLPDCYFDELTTYRQKVYTFVMDHYPPYAQASA